MDKLKKFLSFFLFSMSVLDGYVKHVCNCARAEPKLGLSEAVSYCINKR